MQGKDLVGLNGRMGEYMRVNGKKDYKMELEK